MEKTTKPIKRKWDKEQVLKDALGYTSRSAWKKDSYGYEAASRNGWLEEACAHMTEGKGLFQKGYWTLEKCIEDAKKYQTKSSWRYSELPNGFNVAKLKGWLGHCCGHMTEVKKPSGYWKSLDNCLQDARRFQYLARWEEESPAAVGSARKHGWLSICTEHMDPSPPANLKWTKETATADAKRFDTIGEWREKSGGAYGAASKKGWIKSITAHMVSVLSQGEYQIYRFLLERDIQFETQKRFPECRDVTYLPFDFYLPEFNLLVEFQGIQHIKGYRRDKKDALKIAKRDAIKKEFATSNGYEFLEIWNVSDIDEFLVSRLHQIAKSNGQDIVLAARELSPDEITTLQTFAIWTLDKCMADAKSYSTKIEWMRNSSSAYSTAHKNGWIDLCAAHMTVLWEKKWGLKACQADALKYTTKKEWRAKSSSAYSAAHRKGWIADCCSHMIQLQKPHGYWSLERCQEDAKAYKTKQAWRLGSPSGYSIAKAKKWLPLCCEHMI